MYYDGYFEDYLMKLSTGWGCVPVFNSAVKFFSSFEVFFGDFVTHVLRNHWLHSFEKYQEIAIVTC